MKNISTYILLLLMLVFSQSVFSQCESLGATTVSFESRCAATGAIKINATGGSGTYKYKVTGPVSIDYTSADSITGLSAGVYSVEVFDINNGCTFTIQDVTVGGNYADPRFSLSGVDVSCDNGSNGSILLDEFHYGRAPFTFTIMPPSPSQVGTISSTGEFHNLPAGEYTVRLTDSCGGIQTRIVDIGNYTWKIDSASFTKISCDSASGYIVVTDSRGNISTITGIPGMKYAILPQGSTDTVWSDSPYSGIYIPGINSVQLLAMDTCGIIKSVYKAVSFKESIDDQVVIYDQICMMFSVKVTGMKNLINPNFCLYDKDGNEIACNNDGIFTGLSYGYYCIKVTDDCADTTITRCFTASPAQPSVDDQVKISNYTCTTFDVAITGWKNLTNPKFCIYRNGRGFPLNCNFTGEFKSLPYGYYCVRITEDCSDTTIQRCFMVAPPPPVFPDIIVPSYVNCDNFGLDIDHDGIINPTFCIYDADGNLIECNDTGIFDSIPLGSYCITLKDGCRDTTVQRCITVGPPQAVNDMTIVQRDKTCSTFTASVSTVNLAGGNFCLYNSNGDLLRCDSSGVFTMLPYEDYCIKAFPICPDTVLTTCFSASPAKPSISASVTLKDFSCSDFTASVKGQTNLTSPVYYLTNSSGDTLGFNTSGTFTKLSYGSYCILAKDGCFDTTLSVCFSSVAPVFNITASASRSCYYGYSKFNLSANVYPVTFTIYSPSNVWIYTKTVTGPTVVDSIMNVAAGDQYMIIAETSCGNKDTAYLSPVVGYLKHTPSVEQKCPGGVWPDGSGNLHTEVTTNTGPVTVRLFKKDGVLYNPAKNPDMVSGDKYTFSSYGPGTYIISYQTNDGCNVQEYDTVTIAPYSFPMLTRSTAYQCDKDGFSVGAVVTHGAGPFTYEIIGSIPSTPSIIAGPQSSPIFKIDNGYSYQLIRLRAVDACGNASLGDASILPLADNSIMVSENCVGQPVTMRIDSIPNSVTTWYFKKTKDTPDLTFISYGYKLAFNPLSYADTGYYICKVSINDGCIERTYEYNLSGACYTPTSAQQVMLFGKFVDGKVDLTWEVPNTKGIKEYHVERTTGNKYQIIGKRNIRDYVSPGNYLFTDASPARDNLYRLRIIMEDGKVVYSKSINLVLSGSHLVNIYPNPAVNYVNIELKTSHTRQLWQIELLSLVNQRVILREKATGNRYTLHKPSSLSPGMYVLRVTDVENGTSYNYKVVFNRE